MTRQARHAYAEALRRAGELADALRSPDPHDPSGPVTAAPRPRSRFEPAWGATWLEPDPYEVEQLAPAAHLSGRGWPDAAPASAGRRPPGADAVPAGPGLRDVPPGQASTTGSRSHGRDLATAGSATAGSARQEPAHPWPATDADGAQHPAGRPAGGPVAALPAATASAPSTPQSSSTAAAPWQAEHVAGAGEAARGDLARAHPVPNAAPGHAGADDAGNAARARAAGADGDASAIEVATARPVTPNPLPQNLFAPPSSASQPPATRVIEIEIGRIEVRLAADAPVAPAAPSRPARARTGPALHEYLAGPHDAPGRWSR